MLKLVRWARRVRSLHHPSCSDHHHHRAQRYDLISITGQQRHFPHILSKAARQATSSKERNERPTERTAHRTSGPQNERHTERAAHRTNGPQNERPTERTARAANNRTNSTSGPQNKRRLSEYSPDRVALWLQTQASDNSKLIGGRVAM